MDIKHNYSLLRKMAQASKGKIAPDDNFLNETVAILGENITPVQHEGLYSPEKTLKAITNQQVKDAVHLIAEVKRSSLHPRSMTKIPRYASLTPLVMYALKEHHGVKYSQWDRSDPYIQFMLGHSLKDLANFTGNIEGIESGRFPKQGDELNTLRKRHLTWASGRKVGEMESILAYKINRFYYTPEEGDSNIRQLPKIIGFMLLQLWLANVAYRVEDAMILDPWDWDNVPEPFDLVQPVEELGEKAEAQVGVNLEDLTF